MAQDKKTLPPTEGYDVEFIPLERRLKQRRQNSPQSKLSNPTPKERREQERRKS